MTLNELAQSSHLQLLSTLSRLRFIQTLFSKWEIQVKSDSSLHRSHWDSLSMLDL